MPHAQLAPEAQESSPPAAVWEDFIDIFYMPAGVFERRTGWSAWPVLFALTLMVTLLFLAWQRPLGLLLDLEFERAMAQAMADVDLAAAQAAELRSFRRVAAVIGFALNFPLGVLVTALATWVLAALFRSGTVAFPAVLGVVTYSQMPRLAEHVSYLFQPIVIEVRELDSIHDVSLSVARFMDQPRTTPIVLELAARVDVFSLWATALTAIGLRVVVGLPRAHAWAVALLVWLLSAAPLLLGHLVGGG